MSVMCQLPIDIHDIIFEFLDKATYNRLRRVCKSYDMIIPKIIDMYNLPVELLRNITSHTLLHNPQIKMLDISESKDDMTDISIPNVVLLKSKMICGEDEDGFNIDLNHGLYDISSLRIVINVQLSHILYNDKYAPRYQTPDILIAIYNNSPYGDTGRSICLYDAKPYVLICDMDDCRSHCEVDTSNIQIYQVFMNNRPMTCEDIDPYVLIIRLPEDEYFEGVALSYMENLKCCVLFSYESIYSQLSIYIVSLLSDLAPNLEELYVISNEYMYYTNEDINPNEVNDFYDDDSDNSIIDDDSDDLRTHESNNIYAKQRFDKIWKVLTTSADSKVKYMKLKTKSCLHTYIRKVDEEYTPCCISNVDDYYYALTLDDIYQLYKHFKIPMTSELYKLFVDIGFA